MSDMKITDWRGSPLFVGSKIVWPCKKGSKFSYGLHMKEGEILEIIESYDGSDLHHAYPIYKIKIKDKLFNKTVYIMEYKRITVIPDQWEDIDVSDLNIDSVKKKEPEPVKTLLEMIADLESEQRRVLTRKLIGSSTRFVK